MMMKRLLVIGGFSAVLYGLYWLAPPARLAGQSANPPSVLVMCGDCPGSLFSLTAGRGMLLMKTGPQDSGELWFYPFTPGAKPLPVGRLPGVGQPIVWSKTASRELP